MSGTDESDYRRSFPEIDLPHDGRVPSDSLAGLSTREADRWIGVVGDAWTSVEALHSHRRIGQPHAPPVEVARAWRLWLASHHAFFPVYSLLAHAYDEMLEAERNRDESALSRWTRRSVDLHRAAGALFAVGMDFTPTMEIYEGHIRSRMPEAFSGHWLREAAAVSASRRRWTDLDSLREPVMEAKREELRGRVIYDRYHRGVMRTSVSDGRSLANKYRHINGCPHQITPEEFDVYDRWFRIRRVPMSRLGFVNTTCRAVRVAAENVVTGSRLANAVVTDLVAGLEVALSMLTEWFGPLSEASAHYPKAYRGE
jgi:hypothetical protein